MTETRQDQHPGEELEHGRMSFGEHLEELRGRMFKSVLATLLGLIVCFIFHRDLLDFAVRPFREVMLGLNLDPTLKAVAPTQTFFAYLKVSFIAGLILTAPVWTYQLWAFIAAGLYRAERRVVYRYAPLCLGLFVGGLVFGYLVLIPFGLEYLLTFGDPAVVENWITLGEYLKLFTLLTLVLGLAFQLPVVMLGLVRLGIVQLDTLRRKRRIAILVIFVMAAILTPPDPITQLLLALPLLALFEFGLLLAWLSLGEERPALDRRLVWKRVRILLVVVLGVILVWRVGGPAWHRSQIDSRVAGETAEGDVDLMDLAGTVLQGRPDALFVADEQDRNLTLVARLGERTFVVKARPDMVHLVAHGIEAHSDGGVSALASYTPAARPMWHVERPAVVPLSAFVPGLLEGLAEGSDPTRELCRDLLVRVSGLRPDGDAEAALGAFRAWYGERGSESWLQDP